MIENPTIERWVCPPQGDPGWPGIFVRAKLNGEHWLDYEIWEVAGTTDEGPFIPSLYNGMEEMGIQEENMYLYGFIKWDGCCQWTFNQTENCTFVHHETRNTALAFWALVVNTIYDLGKELIPTWWEE